MGGRSGRQVAVLLGTGVVAGLLAGLFGVGGGIVIVPALVAFAGFDQRKASGTSLVAMFLTSMAGVISYLLAGNIDWLLGAFVAIGAVSGVWLGSYLLNVLPVRVLRWVFIAFLLFMVVQLFLADPVRGAEVPMTPLLAAILILLGLVMGVLSGLLGIGGGVFLVPVLQVFFGVGDLAAKGTSLLVILPTSVSGTVSNLRKGNADVAAGLMVSVASVPLVFVGTYLAELLDPVAANILFSGFILVVIVTMILREIRDRRRS